MDWRMKPGAPRGPHGVSAYVTKYGPGMGIWIHAYKSFKGVHALPWHTAHNKIRRRSGLTCGQLKKWFIRDEAWTMEIPGFSIAQRRWVDLMSGEGGVVV